MKLFQLVALAATSLFVIGCQQDPGSLTEAGQTPASPDQSFGLKVPANLELQEGVPVQIPIHAWAPASWNAKLRVENLPPGAEFDSQAMVINWTPSYTDGDDAGNNPGPFKAYTFKLYLDSTSDPTLSVSQDLSLRVYNANPPSGLTVDAPGALTEGQPMTTLITVTSGGSTGSIYQLFTEGLPSGAMITRAYGANDKFRLNWTPAYDSARSLDIHWRAVDQNGKTATANTTWQIANVWAPAQIVGPTHIAQTKAARFTFTVENLNGPALPVVSFIHSPTLGQSSITVLQTWLPDGTHAHAGLIAQYDWTAGATPFALNDSVSFQICTGATDAEVAACSAGTNYSVPLAITAPVQPTVVDPTVLPTLLKRNF